MPIDSDLVLKKDYGKTRKKMQVKSENSELKSPQKQVKTITFVSKDSLGILKV